jgi:hypothetical protein
MREVVTYQAPAQLLRSDSVFQKLYSDCLHIVATSSLREGIGESIRDNRWIKSPIITFSELFSELSGSRWSSSKAQLKQFLIVSEVLSNLWRPDEKENLLVLQSMERNQLQLLKTLRTLTELGVRPEHIIAYKNKNSLNKSEKLFIEIWEQICESFSRSSAELRTFFLTNKDFNKYILNWGNSLINDEYTNERIKVSKRRKSNLTVEGWKREIISSLKKKTLILHGFYFITPIQERVFKKLEDLGYNLVFLIAYDSRFPKTFETVKTFLNINQDNTTCVVPDNVAIHPIAARLVESFEGNPKTTIDQKVSVYSDLPHFVETEKTLKGSNESEDMYHLLTPRAKEVEKQLIANDFVPPTKKKLTDYPVGRFLYRLHQMKKRETNFDQGEVIYVENITKEALLDCFSSGCLIINGENMRKYLKQLEKILPYCKSASTFNQWKYALIKIKKEKKKWEERVSTANPLALSNRSHKFHSLPMRQLSYFSVENNEIDKIIEGIETLEGMNCALFSSWDTNKVNISTHLRTLNEHVLQDIEVYMENEEKEVVKNLINEISKLNDDELKFSLKDISQGLLFYLDGTLEDIVKQEQAVDGVFSFDHADAAPFKTYRNFHLAFADHKALPINQGNNLWPVSNELLKYLEYSFTELKLFEERKVQSNSITRYLLYVLFHSADDIRFSYVSHLGKESRLELALYLKLLGCEIENVPREIKEVQGCIKEEPREIDASDLDWTPSMKRSAKVCGKRASFSFILNEHITFTSDFHHGFLYQNMIDSLSYMNNNDLRENEIRSIVDKWFPQWNRMKKDFLYESGIRGRKPVKENNVVDEIEYSQALNYLHLLPNGYGGIKANIAKEQTTVITESKSGNHCRYCPYLSICVDGIYQIDYDDNESNNIKVNFGKKSIAKNKKVKKNKQDFSLTKFLKSNGIEFIDKRPKNGNIWIVGGVELQKVVDELYQDRKIKFTFSKNGGKATKKRTAWFSNYRDD